MACAETSLKHSSPASLVENFLRSKGSHELINVVGCAFCHEKLAGTNVKERHATSLLAEMNCAKEVVLLVVEHRVRHRNAWRD